MGKGSAAPATPDARNWATHYAPGIVLFDADGAPTGGDAPVEVPRFKWIHCCNEGLYEGHHQGPFEMTRTVFESFVRNFRAHPQFREGSIELGAGEKHTGGVAPVLQFDYEHASECPPWEGTIPSSGAPACGWVLDLAIRNRPDGKASLWALGELLDDLRVQIRARKQRWVSIAFTLEGIHWITRKPIGPMLTSIAITNHPFMLDLEPLAASRRASQPGSGGVRSASDRSEAPGSSREPTRTDKPPMEDKLRERICRALKIQVLADDAAVGAAVEEAVTGNGSLKSLLEALGVSKVDEAMAAIPELRSARDKMAGLLSELDALLAQESAADAGVAKTDVGAAMRAGKLTGTGAEEALVAFRKSLIDAELAKVQATKKNGEHVTLSERRAAVEAGRKTFLHKYGLTNTDHAHLARTLVAGAGGEQREPPKDGGTVLPIEPTGDKPRVDLRDVPGPNPLVRLAAHLRKTDPSFEKLPWSKQIQRASEYRKTVELVV